MTALLRPLSLDVPEPDPSEGREERDCIASTLAGDTAAYGQLVRMHQSRVFNFIYQMTRQRQDAEDLAQQTFIKAYRNLQSVDPSRPLINWLLTIARHTTLNHFRDTKRWSELALDPTDSDPSPARAAELRETESGIWERARARLSAREFEVMWLRFAEELSTRETARIVGLTETHVKVLVFRARRALAQEGIA